MLAYIENKDERKVKKTEDMYDRNIEDRKDKEIH
jgi:hypothetical protein